MCFLSHFCYLRWSVGSEPIAFLDGPRCARCFARAGAWRASSLPPDAAFRCLSRSGTGAAPHSWSAPRKDVSGNCRCCRRFIAKHSHILAISQALEARAAVRRSVTARKVAKDWFLGWYSNAFELEIKQAMEALYGACDDRLGKRRGSSPP